MQIILLSPLLWLCMMAVGAELIFGVNVIKSFDPVWVAANIAFGLLFVPDGVAIARALRRRWQHHPFWRNLLDDISGRSLVTAQQELKGWVELGDDRSA
ncbi:MAG: hypothetical protein ABSG53_16440 [Thermoguttaceae bacterium]